MSRLEAKDVADSHESLAVGYAEAARQPGIRPVVRMTLEARASVERDWARHYRDVADRMMQTIVDRGCDGC